MQFKMQIGNPATLPPEQKYVEDIAAAIQEIFPMMTEDVIIFWNNIPVQLNYKYDLSVIILDLLPMLDKLLANSKGTHRVFFGSDTFLVEWLLDWAEGCLTITSRWESIVGDYKDALNQHNKIEIERAKFIEEWKALLRKVVEVFDQSGIEVEDQQSLADLRRIESSITEFGSLYADRKPVAVV